LRRKDDNLAANKWIGAIVGALESENESFEQCSKTIKNLEEVGDRGFADEGWN
jgi:hypothetical protein